MPDVANHGTDVVQSFQLAPQSIREKSEKAYGLALARKIESTLGGANGASNYYTLRNARFLRNRNIANGTLDVYELFKDRLDFGGKQNYANLNWACIKLGNRIISGLVGRWMGRGEKIQVTATDPLSTKQKQEEYENLEFYLENRAMMERLQAESGVQLMPQDMPEDQQGLQLWVTQIQKLPEEICFEMGCNEVLASNGMFDAVKEKLLHDSGEVGFVGTYACMDEYGVIRTEWVKPENSFYSYSEYDDFRDTTYRGRIRSLKISELRRDYGKEFGGELTEEQLFELAARAKEYQASDKMTWNQIWVNSLMRPYDEWNVDVLEFEWKTVDTDSYTVVKTKKNKSTILKKGRPYAQEDNEEVVEDTHWNIYRGVYVRGTDTMLEWGLKTNMIRPQDPKEVGNAEFSYSYYMYQSRDMRNLAIPEKIEEPLFGMILARLRMEQLVAKMKPVGAAINVDAMQELDLGLAQLTTPWEAKRIWEQTGDLFYKGRDAEGNPIPVPITELTNSGFLPQMQALIQLYQFNYSVLRDELGEDPNLITQAAQPRVAVQNIDTAQQQGENATGYMYRAYLRVLQDTAVKISCLLHKSVSYGAAAYRALLKKEDVVDRMFTATPKMLSDAYELQRFEAMLNQAMISTPELVLFVNAFQLMRVAKEDVKLAEELFRQGQKRMLENQKQMAQQNQQATFQAQVEAGRQTEEEKRKTAEMESRVELLKTQTQGDMQAKNTLLTGVVNMYLEQMKTPGAQMPAEMQMIAKAVLENVAVPAMIQNEQVKQSLLQQMTQQMAQEQQEQQAQEQQEQQNLQVA